MAGVNLSCAWRDGFVMDPSKKQRVGYLVYMEGLNLGEYLKQDVEVFSPFTHAEAPAYGEVTMDRSTGKLTCVGVIESFSFAGGVGDPVCISAYISAQNAEVLAAKLKTTVDTNTVKKLAWWICNFDEENKVWYEEAYPLDPTIVNGQINASGGGSLKITVSPEAEKVASNIDSNVYNLYLEVIPAANSTFAFHFATSSKTKYARNWGLKVGSNAAAAMG
ncbi:MAG: hypothetical protein RL653_99 [Pseudomonadota bacterium]|jgi:hypothetical protein